MSNSTATINPTQFIADWLGTLTHMYVSDLQAIPADKLATSPGGKARSPQAITAEVVWLLDWMTGVLEAGSQEGDEQKGPASYMDTLTSHSQMVGAVRDSSQKLSAAITAAPASVWESTVMAPWKMESSCFATLNTVVNHLWYHDGQLNMIHLLAGDEKIHWM